MGGYPLKGGSIFQKNLNKPPSLFPPMVFNQVDVIQSNARDGSIIGYNMYIIYNIWHINPWYMETYIRLIVYILLLHHTISIFSLYLLYYIIRLSLYIILELFNESYH